jgi:hypothetical protein
VAFPRGRDIAVKVMRDGEEQAVFRSKRSMSWDPGLAEDIDNFLGQDAPDVSGINNETRLDCPFVPDSPAYIEILEVQREKNNGNPDFRDIVIDVSFTTDYGVDGRSRVLIPDTTLITGTGLEASSRTDKATASPTFVGSFWRRSDPNE